MAGIPQEQPPVREDPNLAEWLSRMMLLINGELSKGYKHARILISTSYDVQAPSSLDTPLQISFGDPTLSIDHSLSVEPDGTIICNKAGVYEFIILATLFRSGTPLTAYTYFYISVNGVNLDTAWMYSLPEDGITTPVSLTITPNLFVGDELRLFFVRDSSGVNDGGLSPFFTALASTPDIPSASVTSRRTLIDE